MGWGTEWISGPGRGHMRSRSLIVENTNISTPADCSMGHMDGKEGTELVLSMLHPSGNSEKRKEKRMPSVKRELILQPDHSNTENPARPGFCRLKPAE